MKTKFSLPIFRPLIPVIILALLAGNVYAAAPDQTGKRYAILIGVNDYADSSIVKLSTARNDASDLGERLVADGWDKVFVLRDDVDYRNQDFPSRTNIENRVNLLADLVKPEDTIFLFFSGHGISSGKEASILPVDASLNRLNDTSIKLSSLLSVFSSRGLRKVIVAVDACREEVSTTKGLSVVGISGASGGNSAALALFATKAGWYSYEDAGGRNGVFTRFVLEGLSGKADSAGASGAADGIVTFSELASWLPDATGSYALDKGIRQQAVATFGSGDTSALHVAVARSSSSADVKSGSLAAAPVVAASAGAAGTAGEIEPLLNSIKGHVTTAVVNSLKDIDRSLGKEKAESAAAKESAPTDQNTDFEYEMSFAADSDEPVDSSPSGGSPVASDSGNDTPFFSFSLFQFGLFSPLQLFPKRFTIGGLAVGIIQTSNESVYGFQIAPIAVASRIGGIQTGVICTSDAVYGLQTGGLVNSSKTVYGVQCGFINTAEKVCGAQIGFINTAKALYGAQIGFINVMSRPGLFGKFMFGLNIGF